MTRACGCSGAPSSKMACCAAISSALTRHANWACAHRNAGGNHNLILKLAGGKSAAPDCAGLLKQMGRGLLVTELLGHGINPVTGDYSRGAAGFWVEHGEIQYPVQEITIAGNLKDMFRNIVAVGNDVLVQGSRQCGSILVEGMTVAGR